MLGKLIELKNRNSYYIFLILFFVILIMRSHTLFNDYYDRDFQTSMVATWHYLETGDESLFSRGLPYKVFFYYPLKIFGKYNWRILHLLAITLIFITSLAVYYACRKLVNDNAGFFAAFFYAFFINCYSKDFLAFSAEIIFNTYISLSFLLLVFAELDCKSIIRKIFFLLLAALFAWLASQVKLHAAFYFLVPICYFIIFKPPTKKLKIWSISLSMFIFMLVVVYDLFYSNNHLINQVFHQISSAINYIFAPDNMIDYVLLNMLLTVITLLLSQFLLWILFFRFFRNFKQKYIIRKTAYQLLLLFSIFSLIPAVLTLRFYPHYFIQLLLPATFCGGIAFEDWTKGSFKDFKYKKFVTIWIMLPLCFFLMSYYSFVGLKAINPDFHFEHNMFVPHTKLRKTINWLKTNSKPTDRIMVWGNAVEIYYFSRRPTSGTALWLKTLVSKYFRELDKNGKVSKTDYNFFENIIAKMEKNHTSYFIDTQPSNFSNFGRYKIKETPLYQYIKDNYIFAYNADDIIIYKRR